MVWPPKSTLEVKWKLLPLTEPSLISFVPKLLSTRPERLSPCCVSVSVELTGWPPKDAVSAQVPERLAGEPAGGVFGLAGGLVPPGGCVPAGGVVPPCGFAPDGGAPPARVPTNVPEPRPTTCTLPRISPPVIVPAKIASVVCAAGAGSVTGTVKLMSPPLTVPLASVPEPSWPCSAPEGG